MLRRALLSTAVGSALLVAPATAALAHGSDAPTPYRVTSTAIELPTGRVLGDNAHVNVHYTFHGVQGSASLATEIAGKPDHDLASAHEVAWSRIGVPDGAYVTWVQVSGFDEHFGEGGQKPVCVTRPPRDCPGGTPTPAPSATTSAAPTASPHAWPGHHRPAHPARPTPTTSAPAPAPSAAGTPAHVPAATPPAPHRSAPAATGPARGDDTPVSRVEDASPAPSPSPSAGVSAPDDATPDASPSPTAYVLADDDATLASTGGDARGPAALAGALVLLGAAATVVARTRRGAHR
jgi:hypothetical protein